MNQSFREYLIKIERTIGFRSAERAAIRNLAKPGSKMQKLMGRSKATQIESLEHYLRFFACQFICI